MTTKVKGLKAKYNIGIDIGGTTIKAGIIDEKGEFLELDKNAFDVFPVEVRDNKVIIETKTDISGKDFIYGLSDLVAYIMIANKLEKANINSLGICAPGWIREGDWVYCNSIPNVSGAHLTKDLENMLGIPVYAANDAKAAAVAEYEHRKSLGKSMLFFIVGTGIGGAYIDKNGKLFESDDNFNLEVGHTVVDQGASTRDCNCGRKGHFEAHASTITLVNMANEKYGWTQDEKQFLVTIHSFNDLDEIGKEKVWWGINENQVEYAVNLLNQESLNPKVSYGELLTRFRFLLEKNDTHNMINKIMDGENVDDSMLKDCAKQLRDKYEWIKNGETIYGAAKAGNQEANELINDQIEQLAIGISNANAIMNSRQIVISGAMSKSFDFIKDRLIKRVNEMRLSPELKIEITAGQVQDGGILGAAALYKQYGKEKVRSARVQGKF